MLKENYKKLSILLSFLIFLTSACESRSQISGIVYDSENNTIEKADIKFEAIKKNPSSETECRTVTDRSGYFSCSFMHASFSNVRLKLIVTKQGYKTYETTFEEKETQGNRGKDLKIILEKSNP
ncbi:MAG TPA: carboxypeptidase-like regulatory domain-containing protein [Pyrinomonadaceae bacterium]|jgi:hypothetical protein